MSGMLTLKASVAAAVLAGTALVSAGAGYAISRATLTAQVAVSCPAPTVAAALARNCSMRCRAVRRLP